MPGYSEGEIADEVYEHALEYKTWPGYTVRERLLIEFMERYMLDYRGVCADDEFWKQLKANLSEVEIADACMLAGHWECARRTIHLLLGIDEICDIPEGDVAPSQHARELGIAQPVAR
jgi:alkylhydroperoxidase family enzyme